MSGMQKFLLGLKEVGPNFDYYAFSDQDDIWEINKIELALKKIKVLIHQNQFYIVLEQLTILKIA